MTDFRIVIFKITIIYSQNFRKKINFDLPFRLCTEDLRMLLLLDSNAK